MDRVYEQAIHWADTTNGWSLTGKVSLWHSNDNQCKSKQDREFPRSLMVRAQHFLCCSLDSIPDLGTEIPDQAIAPPQKKTNPKKQQDSIFHLMGKSSYIVHTLMAIILEKGSFIEHICLFKLVPTFWSFYWYLAITAVFKEHQWTCVTFIKSHQFGGSTWGVERIMLHF